MTAQNKIIRIFGHGGNSFSKIINNSITMERVNESIYIKEDNPNLVNWIGKCNKVEF